MAFGLNSDHTRVEDFKLNPEESFAHCRDDKEHYWQGKSSISLLMTITSGYSLLKFLVEVLLVSNGGRTARSQWLHIVEFTL